MDIKARCAIDLHMSLFDLDRSDIVSLMRFAFHIWGEKRSPRLVPIDQAAGWLD